MLVTWKAYLPYIVVLPVEIRRPGTLLHMSRGGNGVHEATQWEARLADEGWGEVLRMRRGGSVAVCEGKAVAPGRGSRPAVTGTLPSDPGGC